MKQAISGAGLMLLCGAIGAGAVPLADAFKAHHDAATIATVAAPSTIDAKLDDIARRLTELERTAKAAAATECRITHGTGKHAAHRPGKRYRHAHKHHHHYGHHYRHGRRHHRRNH